jgi:excisionase family DNA binding protein
VTRPQAAPADAGHCVGATLAAEILGVTERTVLRWAENGTLPVAYRTKGGHRRFAMSDLRVHLENHA